jgi:hypothetical protein
MLNLRDRILNGFISSVHHGPIGLEVWLGLTSLRWGIFMILPESVLHNTRGSTMSLMTNFAPDWLWTVFFIAFAIAQTLAAVGKFYKLRLGLALFGIFWWLMITLMDTIPGISAATINIFTLSLGQIIAYMLLVIAYDPKELS